MKYNHNTMELDGEVDFFGRGIGRIQAESGSNFPVDNQNIDELDDIQEDTTSMEEKLDALNEL